MDCIAGTWLHPPASGAPSQAGGQERTVWRGRTDGYLHLRNLRKLNHESRLHPWTVCPLRFNLARESAERPSQAGSQPAADHADTLVIRL